MTKIPIEIALGRVVATPAAMENIPPEWAMKSLVRHSLGDWGEVDPEDAATNDEAVAHGGRLVSCYTTPGGVLWVITEEDHSVTTLLLPSDY
jgi:hypothetical protein